MELFVLLFMCSMLLGAIVVEHFIMSGKPLSCHFGIHEYYPAYIKEGMYMDSGTIVGTRRQVYKCTGGRCNKEKPAEEKDYSYIK